jgi:type IV pilus assembly protein PilZ
MSEATSPSARPSVLSMNINSKSALYAAYMPFLANGGLFVPTPKQYRIGDEVFVLLQLMDDPTKHAVAATVAWITPPGAQGGKTQGVGLHFSADDAGKALRSRIETVLAGLVGSARQTHTL